MPTGSPTDPIHTLLLGRDPIDGDPLASQPTPHYDSWGSLPLRAFVTFNDEVEQYLCAAILRPGNAPATRGARGTLIRLIDLLRHAFPKARLLVRLDGGFATPAILDQLDAEPRLDYVVRADPPGPARAPAPSVDLSHLPNAELSSCTCPGTPHRPWQPCEMPTRGHRLLPIPPPIGSRGAADELGPLHE